MNMIPMQFELVSGQYPARFAPVSQSFGPRGRTNYLIRPPPGRDAGQDLARFQGASCCSVALDGLPVYPPHIRGPAEIMCVGQAAGLTVALWYAWAVRNAGE